jgi:deazaflavin-dependent oxidoreductase (nitroreductase family)
VTTGSSLADEQFCYLTTIGRRTGLRRTIEIWFALHQGRLYMLAGNRDRSDWVRNIMREPAVLIRLRDQGFEAQGRIVAAGTAEDALARRLLLAKYQPGSKDDLTSWGREALAVAFDFDDD